MKRVVAVVAFLAGMGLVAAAVFAAELGLDHNAGWGRGRIALLSLGVLIVAVVIYGQRLVHAVAPRLECVMCAFRETRLYVFLAAHGVSLLAGVIVLSALAVYVFFLSAGTWTKWPESTRYYDDLGAAFRAGRLDLNIQPSAALMVLPDPYEPSVRNSTPGVRAFVDRVWDLTFYHGKFYVYWGPGPAVLLAIVKLFYAGPIADQYLVFIFLAGLLAFSTLLILRLRRDAYADTPISLAVIGILFAALLCPIPWMLNRAAIYEATIAGGQFFLIGGLYFAYTGVTREPASLGRLLLAGIFWAFAASSRTLMLIPAAFLTFMMILWRATSGGRSKPALSGLPRHLILAVPLVLGTAAVAWYNWARFGSVFETGLRYTLTFENLDKFYSESFSAYYALPSLWMFLFNPFQIQAKFPFLVATFGRSPAFLYLNKPGLYHAEDITGLVLSATFILFSLVAIGGAVRMARDRYLRRRTGTEDCRSQRLLWISLSLAGSGLLTFAAIILYFNITMRFLAEFLPSLVPLAVLGTWQGYRQIERKGWQRQFYSGVVIAVGLISILVSLLLAFSESHGTVQHYNPHLMRQLIRFFGG